MQDTCLGQTALGIQHALKSLNRNLSKNFLPNTDKNHVQLRMSIVINCELQWCLLEPHLFPLRCFAAGLLHYFTASIKVCEKPYTQRQTRALGEAVHIDTKCSSSFCFISRFSLTQPSRFPRKVSNPHAGREVFILAFHHINFFH